MQSISNNIDIDLNNFNLEIDTWCFVKSIDYTLKCLCPVPLDSEFGIVEPFPENIYPLEFTEAEVTCVAFDAKGLDVPGKIKFMRRNQFNRFTELIPNDNLRFSNKSELEGKYCICTCICSVLRFVYMIL